MAAAPFVRWNTRDLFLHISVFLYFRISVLTHSSLLRTPCRTGRRRSRRIGRRHRSLVAGAARLGAAMEERRNGGERDQVSFYYKKKVQVCGSSSVNDFLQEIHSFYLLSILG